MIKTIALLGSTGSIGNSTLKSINKDKKFKIILLTTNSNIKKIYEQAVKFKVKNVIVEDKEKYKKFKYKFKKKKINLYLGINKIKQIIKKKNRLLC